MIDFKLTLDGGEALEFIAEWRDLVTWSKTNRSDDDFPRKPHDLNKVAWIAARRQGLFSGTNDQFDKSVVAMTADEMEEPNPTQPAP